LTSLLILHAGEVMLNTGADKGCDFLLGAGECSMQLDKFVDCTCWTWCVTAARAWNRHPTSVTTATSLASLKKQLKTFLFTKSFREF